MQGLHLWVHALCQHHRRPLAVRPTSLVVLGGVPDEPAALLLHQRPAHLQLTHRALPVCSSERRSIGLLLHTSTTAPASSSGKVCCWPTAASATSQHASLLIHGAMTLSMALCVEKAMRLWGSQYYQLEFLRESG